MGVNSIAYSTRWANASYLRTLNAAGGIGGSAVDMSGPALSAYGARSGRGGGVLTQGTRAMENHMPSPMVSYFGQSPAANRFVLGPVYSGSSARLTYPQTPIFGDSETERSLFGTLKAAGENSYYYKTLAPLPLGNIRDDQTNESIRNLPPVTEDELQSAAAGRSATESLAAAAAARNDKRLEDAWRLLKRAEGSDLLRARAMFDAACQTDRNALGPRVGKLLAAVTDGQFMTGLVDLRIMAGRHENLFAVKYRLREVVPPQRGEDALTTCAVTVRSSPDDDSFAALQSYLLWLDGQRAAALAAAEGLSAKFRSSPYAFFAEEMRAQMAAEESGKQAPPAAAPVG